MLNKPTKSIPHRLLGLLLFSITLPTGVWAQYYDSPGLGEKPVASHPQDYKPLGIRAGAFMLHPGVQLAGEYTDNAFYSSADEQSDTIFHIRPYITAQSTWSRHSLNVTAAADIARYNDFGERDYEDYFFGISGRVDVRNRSFFSYSADYMDLHEGLNNRSSEQGVEPTTYTMYGGHLGYDHTFNRLSLGAGVGMMKLDFDDVLGADGEIIDNQDRDREETDFFVRAGYQFQTDKQFWVSYSGFYTDYDEDLDRNGYDRNGDGYSIGAGLNFTITGKLSGDFGVNYLDHSYDDPRLEDVDGWAFGAGLQWNPTQLTTVYGNISSSVEETTDENSSGYLQTVYSLRVDHELTRSVQLNGFVSYRNNDYEPIAEPIDPDVTFIRDSDDVWRWGVGANWFINRYLYLNASYAYEKLNSSLPGDDYEANTVWLVLGLER